MMKTRGGFIRLAPSEADIERRCNRAFFHHAYCIAGPREFLSAHMRTLIIGDFIIGDFGLAHGSAGPELDRRDVSLGCYSSSI